MKINYGKNFLNSHNTINTLKYENIELKDEINDLKEKNENLKLDLKENKNEIKILSGKISSLKFILTQKEIEKINFEKIIYDEKKKNKKKSENIEKLEILLKKEKEVNFLLIKEKKLYIDNNYEMVKKSKDIKNINKNIFNLYEKSKKINSEYEKTIKNYEIDLQKKKNLIHILVKEKEKKKKEFTK